MKLAGLALLLGLLTSIAVAPYISAYGSIHSLRGMSVTPAPADALPSWLRDDWPAPTQVRTMAARKPGYVCVGVDCLAEGSTVDQPPGGAG